MSRNVIGQNVKPIPYIAALVFLAAGCEHAPPPQRGASAGPSALRSADEYIGGWAEMGMWLPDQEQVRFFDKHFETVREPLCNALSHSNYSVRMRAGYVIGEIGERAKAAGPPLLSRLKDEPDELVRIYIVDALSTIDLDSDATISFLKKRFDSLDSTNVPPNADHSYAEVDEKISIAAALYALDADDTKATYLTFVTDWLKPPRQDLDERNVSTGLRQLRCEISVAREL